MESIPDVNKLGGYYLLYAVLGEFQAQLNAPDAAADHFRKSLQLTGSKSEQNFLSKRLRACEAQLAG